MSHAAINKFISYGALLALVGYITSGPLGLAITQIHPQPPWVSAKEFAANYSVVQVLPYYFGFLLVGGMLMMMAGHYINSQQEPGEIRFHVFLSLIFSAAFSALIFFNYIAQTTFVHHMATSYQPAYDSAISIFSMTNSMSLCWAIEMWGYAILGVATWLLAVYYKYRSSTIRYLLIANGVLSIISAFYTAADVTWMMTGAGLIAYLVWNVLMIVLMILIYLHNRSPHTALRVV